MGYCSTLMRTKSVAISCAAALALIGFTPTSALAGPAPEAVVADVLVARPACLVATVAGSAFFVVALPFAAISKSTKKTADALVVKPAKATFTRPVGDLESLTN